MGETKYRHSGVEVVLYSALSFMFGIIGGLAIEKHFTKPAYATYTNLNGDRFPDLIIRTERGDNYGLVGIDSTKLERIDKLYNAKRDSLEKISLY